jgi:hypothetical protein
MAFVFLALPKPLQYRKSRDTTKSTALLSFQAMREGNFAQLSVRLINSPHYRPNLRHVPSHLMLAKPLIRNAETDRSRLDAFSDEGVLQKVIYIAPKDTHSPALFDVSHQRCSSSSRCVSLCLLRPPSVLQLRRQSF